MYTYKQKLKSNGKIEIEGEPQGAFKKNEFNITKIIFFCLSFHFFKKISKLKNV